MSDIISVQVVKVTDVGWWYQHMIGKTIDVRQAENDSVDYYSDGAGNDSDEGYILKADCVIVVETLQERLQQAKAAVEAIEKQLVEEAEKEAPRTFTQAEYEKVVAEYRGCAGRVKVDLINNDDKYCFTICGGDIYADSWNAATLIPFGVAFNSKYSAKNAIAKVGAENLKKAWEHEMSIGL